MNKLVRQLENFQREYPGLIGNVDATKSHFKHLFEYRHKDFDEWTSNLNHFSAMFEGVNAQFDRPQITIYSQKIKQQEILDKLNKLMPWRKGPFVFNDIILDSEWRSDWKFQRLLDSGIDFTGAKILDVGTGNGYFLYRLLGSGARMALGVDPSWLFFAQYLFLESVYQSRRTFYFPCTLDDVQLKQFDIVMSMGVLYHRRDPLYFLDQLKNTLSDNGQLIIETLVVDGDESTVYTPRGRYFGMKNVWFLPSPAALKKWLEKLGLEVIYCSDPVTTSNEEQRKTPWMCNHSLQEFMDTQTEEESKENPKPQRCIFIATKK